jgi:CsoR family transcriptional regulator, copper-sensing transcriptional repressor
MPKGIPKDKSVKREIIHHLKIARGHLDRVIKMVDEDEYCIDIIHQSQAVQAALKNVDQKILQNHMETCVAHSMKEGRVKDVVDEVMKVIKKS